MLNGFWFSSQFSCWCCSLTWPLFYHCTVFALESAIFHLDVVSLPPFDLWIAQSVMGSIGLQWIHMLEATSETVTIGFVCSYILTVALVISSLLLMRYIVTILLVPEKLLFFRHCNDLFWQKTSEAKIVLGLGSG